MKALFNNQIVEEILQLDIRDRALQYGDGLFETIAVKNRKPKHLDYHLARLKKGAEILNLDLPAIDFEQKIAELLNINMLEHASLKLMVWRKASDARGFGFSLTATNYMLICRVVKESPTIQRASFAETITFNYSALSPIKTLNALPYILAANEKQQRALDELIVLNNDGFICECVSSNIFWLKDGIYYTPPIRSGCLDGVTRKVLIEKMRQMRLEVMEVMYTPAQLLTADSIFTTNSSGIRFIKSIDDHSFDTSLADDPLFSV